MQIYLDTERNGEHSVQMIRADKLELLNEGIHILIQDGYSIKEISQQEYEQKMQQATSTEHRKITLR